jgi:hypothetical protein
MSPVYLYAVLAEPPAGALPSGLAGEPVRLVACADIWAAVGDVASAPAVDEASLRAHDAAVRRLAAGASALLPARFGSIAGDERALCDALQPRLDAFREGLRAVRGCEQMTLRFARRDAAAPEAAAALPSTSSVSAGPGTRYLDARRASAGDPRAIPEVGWVLDAVALSCAASGGRGTAVRPSSRPSITSWSANRWTSYRAAVASAADEAGVRVTLSGPWPPYAFAPDELA